MQPHFRFELSLLNVFLTLYGQQAKRLFPDDHLVDLVHLHLEHNRFNCYTHHRRFYYHHQSQCHEVVVLGGNWSHEHHHFVSTPSFRSHQHHHFVSTSVEDDLHRCCSLPDMTSHRGD